ncbi:carboxymuconolactone decarboxylase family protein [Aeromicrobium terrae]|nr:carboxymuconolactone decarboxylase family protein [Aeromicrobium terrae]
MTHPVFVVPAAMEALQAYSKAAHGLGISNELIEMVHLRASQINGCSVCVGMHSTALKKEGTSDERLFSIAAWRETPYFTDAERAALELTEVVTRIADKGDAVPDAIWDEAARHFDDEGLSGLLIAITSINVWNRLNAATHQMAGADWA